MLRALVFSAALFFTGCMASYSFCTDTQIPYKDTVVGAELCIQVEDGQVTSAKLHTEVLDEHTSTLPWPDSFSVVIIFQGQPFPDSIGKGFNNSTQPF